MNLYGAVSLQIQRHFLHYPLRSICYIKIIGLCLKLLTELHSQVSVGRAFQTVGAATAKLCVTNVVLVLGTASCGASEDLSDHQVEV